MSIQEKNKKDKKKKKETNESDVIPSDLEGVSLPKREVKPPKPVTLSEGSKNIPRPTRLPPRFREKLKGKTTESKPNEPVQESKPEEEVDLEGEKDQDRGISSPVSMKRTREPIPKPRMSKPGQRSQVKPTRISLEDQEQEISAEVDALKANYGSQSPLPVLSQELILSQFDVSSILERPLQDGWPWVKSQRITIPQELELFWRAEASLFSAIASLQFFTNANENGEIAPEVYSKQLKSHLMEAIQLRFKLEKDERFNWEEFVKENNVENYFPLGLEKLARVSGSSDIDQAISEETVEMDYQEIKKMPTKAADFVGNSIELMDIIRLQSIATVERLIPLIEDLKKIILSAKMFGEDYWIIKEIDSWIKRLYAKEPGTIPEEEELERLEMHVVRWLNDFRRELKNL